MKSIQIKLLYILSKKILKKYHPDVIGIVGNVGKSTTKEAVYSVLSSKFKVRKNDGVYSNDLEIPLTIIGKKNKNYSFVGRCRLVGKAIGILLSKQASYPDILILEIETKQQNNLSFLMNYISFRVAIVTDTKITTINGINSTKKLAEEEELLVDSLSDEGIAILNIDEELINSMTTKATAMTFGFDEKAQIRASEPIASLREQDKECLFIEGINFKLHYKGSVVPILMPGALGVYQIYSGLTAIACGLVFQMNLSDISHSLKKYRAPAGRMKLIPGIKHTTIIDSSYDASPYFVKKAIEALSIIPLSSESEKYAILGDMLNLGSETENIHREIGRHVSEKEIDKLITVGEKSKYIALAARKAGMAEDKVFSFSDTKSAGRFVQDRLEKNDIILIKGATELRMERIVKELMAEPLKSRSLLVRR